MTHPVPRNTRATFEHSDVYDVAATGASRVEQPPRDFLKSVERRAGIFVKEGLEPEKAEQKAVEEF